MKSLLYTIFALVAFAFNSILCRLALRGDEADAAGFTAVRFASGAAMLVVISFVSTAYGSGRGPAGRADESPTGYRRWYRPESIYGTWPSAFFLFAYAVCFSFAYLGLTAGTGALILFGAVQMTMIAAAIFKGERPTPVEWCGLAVAVGGLVYLVFPGLASPPPVSSTLMAAAGASWGVYTLRGRTGGDPLANTTGNFVRALPFVVLLALIYLPNLHLSARGVVLAVLSGAVASGVGYTVWYAALKHLTSTRAAILQLAVPVIAAVFGVVLLSEAAGLRLVIAAVLILGGIGLTIFGRKK